MAGVIYKKLRPGYRTRVGPVGSESGLELVGADG